MQRRTADETNELLKRECNRALGAKENRATPDPPLRKPAIYRSVGIRVPGNDSLIVVHVREY